MKFNLIFCIALVSLMTSLFIQSCSKMDATYIGFLENGERSYAQRADSVLIRAGHNRVEVYFLMISDPRITNARVYWNNRADSMSISINKTSGIDTIRSIIPNLPEGQYSFEIVTFDKYGAKSIPVSKQGHVYGERYISSLLDRPVLNSTVDQDSLYLAFALAAENVIGNELVYTDKDSNEKSIIVSSLDSLLSVGDYQQSTVLKYRTLFLPDSTALDTFYTEFKVITTEGMIDKANFRRWNHASAPYYPVLQYLPVAYDIEYMWDDGAYNNNNFGFYWESPTPIPMAFSFDMGASVSITRFKLFPQTQFGHLFSAGNPKRFEVWGTNNPDLESDLSEWQFVGSFSSQKPSGLPLGSTNEADNIYVTAGEDFTVLNELPPLRYLRFVIHETWGGGNYFHITELTLWGKF